MRVLAILFVYITSINVDAGESWLCTHPDYERENLTFTPLPDGKAKWEHEKLGELEPLRVIINSDAMLTMATDQLNIMYSRFFHLEKFSGRMGETTFRASVLRRLQAKDDSLNFDSVTTIWECESDS